jgi:hypothetical protein
VHDLIRPISSSELGEPKQSLTHGFPAWDSALLKSERNLFAYGRKDNLAIWILEQKTDTGRDLPRLHRSV